MFYFCQPSFGRSQARYRKEQPSVKSQFKTKNFKFRKLKNNNSCLIITEKINKLIRKALFSKGLTLQLNSPPFVSLLKPGHLKNWKKLIHELKIRWNHKCENNRWALADLNACELLFFKFEKNRLTLRSILKKVPPRHDSLSGGYSLSVVYRIILWDQPSIFRLWSSWSVKFSKKNFIF